MPTLFFIFIFVLGLIIGSFINCLVYRLHVGRSFVNGRSFCPHCKKMIAWYDNIPLASFLILRGHCRSCREKISLSYPLVELAVGILFVLVGINAAPEFSYPVSLALALAVLRDWLFAAVLLALFLYDLKYYLVPDVLAVPGAIVALILNLVIYWADPVGSFWFALGRYLLAGVVAGGFFLLLFIISRGRWIGGGGIRLGFLIGFLTGWPLVLVALFLAYVSGALVGVLLIVLKKKTMESAVPFGAFLAPSAFVTLLYGQSILHFYLSWSLF
jgi:prepilin signal peptidase PulO-like enzyme (type II secretory pathway)